MPTMPASVPAPSLPESSGSTPRHLSLVGAGPPPPTIRVVLVHERRLVRAGLRALLERDPGIAVIGEAASGDEAAGLARRLRPDVMLTDVELDKEPAELIRAVRRDARRGCALNHRPALHLIEGDGRWNSGI
jgi:CheY-like chemotaxis protein